MASRSIALKHAPIWRRIVAFITDFLVVGIVCSVLVMLSASHTPQSFGELTSYIPSPLETATQFYFALFFFVYHLFCEYILGQTAGMLMWRVRVIQIDKSKDPLPRFGQAFLRNLFLFPLLPGIVQGIVWLVEALHYVLAGRRLFEAWSNTDTQYEPSPSWTKQ